MKFLRKCRFEIYKNKKGIQWSFIMWMWNHHQLWVGNYLCPRSLQFLGKSIWCTIWVYKNVWIVNFIAYSLMLRSHQAKAKNECDISSMKTVNLCRAIHTKRKRFRLNGLQSHSSESESDVAYAFAFAWCERKIKCTIFRCMWRLKQENINLPVQCVLALPLQYYPQS